MADSRSSLEGVAALTRQLQALGSLEDGNALRRAVRAGIKPARTQARDTIPVRSGVAKKAIRTIVTINSEKSIASGILGVRKLAYYAVKFIELGTRKMRAQPWLRSSLTDSRDRCEEGLRESLRESVIKAATTT